MKAIYRGALATDPSSMVANTQPAGIGRVAAFPRGLVVNNLGRNLEFLRFAGGGGEAGRLLSARRFAATDFPDEDEPSQFDLDFHSVVAVEEAGLLLALNHFGTLRAFRIEEAWTGAGLLGPSRVWRWPGDVVRAVVVGGCLVSTGSAGYAVDDPMMPGLLVSDPIGASRPDGALAHRIEFAELGVATELVADRARGLLIVAFDMAVVAFAIVPSGGRGVQIGPVLWRAATQCRVAWLAADAANDEVWAAGPDPAQAGANDWDALNGGELVAFTASTGAIRGRMPFPVRLAWGNGGVPLALAPKGAGVLGIDAEGALWSWDRSLADRAPLARGPGATPPDAPHPRTTRPLGIAHMARAGDHVYCGFNRDGYRLHHFALEP